MKCPDVLGLWYDYKKIISTGFTPGQLANLKDAFKKHGFLFKMLDEKHDYKGQRGTCIISKHSKYIKAAAAAYSENRFDIIGGLLGYPECCVRHHFKTFFKSTDNSVRTSAANSESYFWPINNMLDFDGRLRKIPASLDLSGVWHTSLISHNPCSYDCVKSLEIAAANYFNLKKHISRPGPESDYSLLPRPVLYADDFNLAMLNGSSFSGGADYNGAAYILGFNGLEEKIKAADRVLVDERGFSLSRNGKVIFKKTLAKKPLILPFDVQPPAVEALLKYSGLLRDPGPVRPVPRKSAPAIRARRPA
jgi:hypothetical protein